MSSIISCAPAFRSQPNCFQYIHVSRKSHSILSRTPFIALEGWSKEVRLIFMEIQYLRLVHEMGFHKPALYEWHQHYFRKRHIVVLSS